MRVIVVGMGIQGHKRKAAAGRDVVATVDPFQVDADFREVSDVPRDSYDAALLCIPDEPKIALIRDLLSHGKHVLVEKPLFAASNAELSELRALAAQNHVICYTAYNHRFEPHFLQMKRVIESGILGRVYAVRLFYGNGTARLVRESTWRDQGAGVLPDLGSHLLDTALFWFGLPTADFRIFSAGCFENHAPDHVAFGSNGAITLQMEVTLLSWRNHFYADVFAEKGSAHIESLCKWGPSRFVLRDRKLPSGRPDEKTEVLVQGDPTWDAEYQHFVAICAQPAQYGFGNTENDLFLNSTLNQLASQLRGAEA